MRGATWNPRIDLEFRTILFYKTTRVNGLDSDANYISFSNTKQNFSSWELDGKNSLLFRIEIPCEQISHFQFS